MAIQRVLGYVVLTFRFRREGKKWTAYCEELGTATFARTLPEAQRRLEAAVACHVNTLEEVGERERFFREHNIAFYPHKPRAVKLPTSGINRQTFLQPYVQPVTGFAHA